MKKLVVLTGAGMSAESGLSTFRDSNGLWENYPVQQVATPEGWKKNPELVLKFYNMLRKQLLKVKPNDGHKGLVELEKKYDTCIVTQNVDNLHERAGSSNVIHLHGELIKVRGIVHGEFIKELKPEEYEVKMGDCTPFGDQFRPHIVWFGEDVPMMDKVILKTEKADIFVVIGSSLVVYPAAALINFVPTNVPIYVIDPKDVSLPSRPNVHHLKMKASEGVRKLLEIL